jgi:hypothetical protein
MITIRLVRPGEDMNVVLEFYRRQNQSYAQFSAEKAVYAPTEAEIADGSVYYVVAHDLNSGELCGGLRIHLRSIDAQLPVERALPDDQRLQQVLALQTAFGLAEMSGLWVAGFLRRTGFSSELMRVGIAAMPLLEIHRVLAFTHQHVLDFWTPLGFSLDQSLQKTYSYPDRRYRSRIIWIDPDQLVSAEPSQRKRIFLLRGQLAAGQLIYWPFEPVMHAEPPGLEGHAG